MFHSIQHIDERYLIFKLINVIAFLHTCSEFDACNTHKKVEMWQEKTGKVVEWSKK